MLHTHHPLIRYQRNFPSCMGTDGLLSCLWDTKILFTFSHVSRKSSLVRLHLHAPSIPFSFCSSFIIHVSHIPCVHLRLLQSMQTGCNYNLGFRLERRCLSNHLLWQLYFEGKCCQNRGNVIITTYSFLILWHCLWSKCFCEFYVHCSCVPGAAPCTRPMWSAIRGACRLTIPFRWPTSAPRVPRWASLVATRAAAIVTLWKLDCRHHIPLLDKILQQFRPSSILSTQFPEFWIHLFWVLLPQRAPH